MFRLSEEFTFSINEKGVETHFVGQLIFRSKTYNEFGTLYKAEEISVFSNLLNSSIAIPEQWTLEMASELLFHSARTVFPNLYAINLFIKDKPHRVAEYSAEDTYGLGILENDILELEGVN